MKKIICIHLQALTTGTIELECVKLKFCPYLTNCTFIEECSQLCVLYR